MRPSFALPPRDSGSHVQRSSTIVAALVLDDALALDDARVAQAHLAARASGGTSPSAAPRRSRRDRCRATRPKRQRRAAARRVVRDTRGRRTRPPGPRGSSRARPGAGRTTPMTRAAARVQVLADGVLEQRDVDDAVALGDADALAEGADRLGRVPAAPQPGERRHARVVPARRRASPRRAAELALRHHRVRRG